ncbi:MAG: keto-deoxy-phosphogluconate aldolase [Verrucomicrobiales bacterium]|jgi:2-dehydro-3-deoxyphosphogluconate aldolase/(4S)-4-hydroxy-2-oxoglutarate aldolase|nr:keto-deoxy-phosphogluconate aldolase [Verrucomicrobiales bacterium]|tara:strand:- start:6598 stop:7251 length:654 start_codon:yes stop_codon:yes gene_type:complete
MINTLNPDDGPGKDLIDTRLLAVIVIDEFEAAIPLAESLLAGGVNAMELTLRTPVAIKAARRIKEAVPEMMVGIGTVLSTDQADEVLAANANFAVSPGVNPTVIRHAAASGLPFGPGVMTPTDIDVALQEDCRLLKFFPAESSGGLDHLKNISAPYRHLGLKFVPLGGINLGNLSTYLDNELIGAVGGSWIAPRDLVRDRNWKQIESNAREARAIAG